MDEFEGWADTPRNRALAVVVLAAERLGIPVLVKVEVSPSGEVTPVQLAFAAGCATDAELHALELVYGAALTLVGGNPETNPFSPREATAEDLAEMRQAVDRAKNPS